MTFGDLVPTAEQQEAIDAFATGDDLVIEAGAGTGKTWTLGLIARSTRRNGQYLAFNRQIAADAARAMPMSVSARTIHSIAYRAISRDPRARPLLDRLNGARVSSSRIAKHLRLGPLIITMPTGRTKVLQPAWQAGHVVRAARAFAASADPEPTRHHFPYVEGIDRIRPDGTRGRSNNIAVALELLPALYRAWEDLTDPAGVLRFDPDVYLKLWALSNPEIPAEYVMFDEAQDASPVMLDVLSRQTKQVVYVGDSQQQIYEWRGAVNALGTAVDGRRRTFLSQSWRFGPDVAEVANVLLDELGADLRLVGTADRASVVYRDRSGPRPAAVLCRTNAAAVSSVMNAQAAGLAPHLVGGAQEIVYFAVAAGRLKDGERTGHPELACFETWGEVQAYVADDPQGSELAMMVNLIDEYGVEIVVEALDGLSAEDDADLIVSTVHKAKGREWPSVRLTDDFPEDPSTSELRLLYVAATRGALGLDLSRCRPLLDLLREPLGAA